MESLGSVPDSQYWPERVSPRNARPRVAAGAAATTEDVHDERAGGRMMAIAMPAGSPGEPLWCLIDAKGRTWHDILARSLVIATTERPSGLV